jgi:hypothetical protein
MKSSSKFSMIALAAALCFAPGVFGQSPTSVQHTAVSGVIGQSILSQGLPSFLTFAFDRDHVNNGGDNNGWGNNGCGSQGGNGWDKGRNDGWGGGGNNGGGHCQSVPEGGSNLMYLFLASLACFGALLIQSLRKAEEYDQVAETAQTKQS